MVRQKHKLISWSVLIFMRANVQQLSKLCGYKPNVVICVGRNQLPPIRIGLNYIHKLGGDHSPPPSGPHLCRRT